jgi:hypothetical protein
MLLFDLPNELVRDMVAHLDMADRWVFGTTCACARQLVLSGLPTNHDPHTLVIHGAMANFARHDHPHTAAPALIDRLALDDDWPFDDALERHLTMTIRLFLMYCPSRRPLFLIELQIALAFRFTLHPPLHRLIMVQIPTLPWALSGPLMAQMVSLALVGIVDARTFVDSIPLDHPLRRTILLDIVAAATSTPDLIKPPHDHRHLLHLTHLLQSDFNTMTLPLL